MTPAILKRWTEKDDDDDEKKRYERKNRLLYKNKL